MADPPRKDVKVTFSLGYTAVGEEFKFRTGAVPAAPEDLEFMKQWVPVAEKLLAEGKLVAAKKDVRSGGLDAIFGGLNDLKEGKVTGTKIVYQIGQA